VIQKRGADDCDKRLSALRLFCGGWFGARMTRSWFGTWHTAARSGRQIGRIIRAGHRDPPGNHGGRFMVFEELIGHYRIPGRGTWHARPGCWHRLWWLASGRMPYAPTSPADCRDFSWSEPNSVSG
jgi:hypothetical protein